jgi:aminoglycoside/choline kinase family phosphotransferase
MTSAASSATSSDFPRRPDEVDPKWLTAQLARHGAFSADAEIRSIEAEPIGQGSGMMGAVTRLHLDYAGEPGAIASVIMKSASSSSTNREVATTFRLYEREVNFYRDVAPSVAEIVPAAYVADVDARSGDYVILLEDLPDYTCGDQVDGCDAESAALALDALVTLHARWWEADAAQRPAWVPLITDELVSPPLIAACAAVAPKTIELFGHLMSQPVRAAVPAFIAALPRLYQEMASGPQTFAHTDYRLDNLLFGRRPEQRPVVVLDWSSVAISKGTHDVAFLLTQNLTIEERRAHERDLVRHYSDALGRNGVTGYSADQAWTDYRLAGLLDFIYALVIGGALELSTRPSGRLRRGHGRAIGHHHRRSGLARPTRQLNPARGETAGHRPKPTYLRGTGECESRSWAPFKRSPSGRKIIAGVGAHDCAEPRLDDRAEHLRQGIQRRGARFGTTARRKCASVQRHRY